MLDRDFKCAAIKFSNALCDCLALYRSFKSDADKRRYTPVVIEANRLHLRTEYMYFIQALVDELESSRPEQWSRIFNDLREAMDGQVFNISCHY